MYTYTYTFTRTHARTHTHTRTVSGVGLGTCRAGVPGKPCRDGAAIGSKRGEGKALERVCTTALLLLQRHVMAGRMRCGSWRGVLAGRCSTLGRRWRVARELQRDGCAGHVCSQLGISGCRGLNFSGICGWRESVAFFMHSVNAITVDTVCVGWRSSAHEKGREEWIMRALPRRCQRGLARLF